jgi:ribonucleoside-triphosphate reductase
MITKIKKRDGRIVPFNEEKITNAIFKAARAVGGQDYERAKILSRQVVENLEQEYVGIIPDVEDVQDEVEKVLIENGHAKTAKAYILYRQQHAEIRDFQNLLINSGRLIQDYIGKETWEVNENSNMNFSLQGLNNHMVSAMSKKYWLEKIYPARIREAHEYGDFHIHDLGLLAPYCCGWDLADLLLEGFRGAPQKIESAPPRHFRSALGQIVNFFYTLQGEAAGAQALANFDTYLAPFIRYDKLTYKEVKQAMQEFIFNLNVPTRVGHQTPFTNISFDIKVPKHMEKEPVIFGGQRMFYDPPYGDYQEEMNMINKAFCEIMSQGDAKGRIFTFPIPTYNITEEFFDSSVCGDIMEMTAKYGTPYFANFINSDLRPEDVRSMCILGNEKLIYVNGNGEVNVNEVRHIVAGVKGGKLYKVLFNGQFVDIIDAFEVDYQKYNHQYVEIVTRNDIRQRFSLDHKQDVLRDGRVITVYSHHIQTGDRIPLSKYGYEGNPSLGDYELGTFLGIYIGDGHKKGREAVCITSNTRKIEIEELCGRIAQRFGSKLRVDYFPDKHCFRASIHSPALMTLVEEFVSGDTALTKRLTNKWRNYSRQFRQGMFDGILMTDGFIRKNYSGHKNDYRLIHTPNRLLVEDLRELCNSLGIKTTTYRHRNTNQKGSFVSYDLKVLNYNGWLSNILVEHDDKYWVEVTSVSVKTQSQLHKVYNITVDHPSHQYELASSIITHNCCRLRLDMTELKKKGGGLFGANPLTGSVGVVTLNLPRIGYKSKNEQDFFERLTFLAELAKDSLLIKRKIIEQMTDLGLYPYSKYYLRMIKERFGQYWANHFNTIGIIGMNEALLNFMGKNIGTPEGKAFALKVMDHLRLLLVKFQEETGQMFNLEATPAEGTSYRLAKIDKELYPDIITAGKDTPYYTNSTQLPVNYTDDIFEALELQDELQTKYTGGTVLHMFAGERIEDTAALKKLLKRIFTQYRLPYLSFTPTFSVCPDHGYIAGEYFKCPYCGKDSEVWSRIVGYYRPVQNWNKGKQEEYYERITYSL